MAEVKRPREHYWDSLRAFLMLLGIPYHVFMSYRRPGDWWIINAGEGHAVYSYLAEFIHLFRMHAFFVVAGYFAALLLTRRSPGLWLKGRFVRLGIPFLTCLVFLNPIMNMACELSNGGWDQAWAVFWQNSTTSGGYWVRHLWFIIVLLYFCAAMAAVVALFPRLAKAVVPERLDAAISRYFLPAMIMLGAIVGIWSAYGVEAFYKAGLATNIWQQILRLDEVIRFAPWFALGVLLERAPLTRERVNWLSPGIVAMTVISMAGSLIWMDDMGWELRRFVNSFAALFMTLALIAICKGLFDKSSPLVRDFVDASFVIYLFHMPIIMVLVVVGQHIAMPLMLKVMLVMTITLALSWGAWWVILRSPLLLFLFDGRKIANGQGEKGAANGAGPYSTQSSPMSR